LYLRPHRAEASSNAFVRRLSVHLLRSSAFRPDVGSAGKTVLDAVVVASAFAVAITLSPVRDGEVDPLLLRPSLNGPAVVVGLRLNGAAGFTLRRLRRRALLHRSPISTDALIQFKNRNSHNTLSQTSPKRRDENDDDDDDV